MEPLNPRDIREALAKKRGDINPDIALGIATKHMPAADKFIKEAIMSNQPGLDPLLTLVDIKRATADETYRVRSKVVSTNNYQYDVTRTDAYLLKIMYSHYGEPLNNIYVNIPYLDDYGEFQIRDTTYHMLPVLADKLFSVSEKGVFISLQKDPMTIERVSHQCRRNGKAQFRYVLHSRIHKADESEKGKGVNRYGLQDEYAKTSLPHYLFARFGLINAFKRFYNIDVIPVDVSDMPEYDEDVLDLFTTSSQHQMPITLSPRFFPEWKPTNIGLLVKKDDINDQILDMIVGMFYVLDTFPDHFRELEFLEAESTWRITLGHFVWNKPQNEGQLDENIRVHLTQTTDHYLDLDARRRLQLSGHFCADYYEFLRELIKVVPSLYENVDPTTMKDKRLTVLRYALSDLVKALNRLGYAVQGMQRQGNINVAKINAAISRTIKPDLVINALTKSHPECVTVPYPNDNPLLKVTSQVVSQLDTISSQGRSNPINDPSKRFNGTIAIYGSMFAPAQSEGTGRTRVNFFAPTDEEGGFIRGPYDDVVEAINVHYFKR